jgi:hypothetical protein
MNVKDFQAGQTGICPVCGVKMQIPLESTRPASKKGRAEAEEEAAPAVSDDAESPATPIEATGATTVAEATVAAVSYPSTAATFAQSPAEVAMADPSSESVVWYVRPPSGGQFGPATTEIMRSWLAQGRITPDTLVWREGWPQWKNANEVFPQLRATGPASAPERFDATVMAAPAAAISPVHVASRAKLPSRKVQLMAFGGLAGVFVILLAIFLAVWMKR